jgi:hypothetical protein
MYTNALVYMLALVWCSFGHETGFVDEALRFYLACDTSESLVAVYAF